MFQPIQIRNQSRIPKYKQLVSSLSKDIQSKNFKQDRLPSINQLSSRLDVSRDTVEKAYRELRKRNLIESVRGKGYYVKFGKEPEKLKVFLLCNKLSIDERIIYNQMVATLKHRAKIDIHVFNNDFNTFKQLLSTNLGHYSFYAIIPHFSMHYHDAKNIIDRIPKHQLLLLDKSIDGISGKYASVYQNFEQNIYDALTQAKDRLVRYQELKLVFPPHTYHPREIIQGFQRFCIDFNFKGKLVSNIIEEPLTSGQVFITLREEDLVSLVRNIRDSPWRVGEEIGILSYNENPLKEVLLGGISVISTNFELMGKTAAQMILKNRKVAVENPFRLILRNSL